MIKVDTRPARKALRKRFDKVQIAPLQLAKSRAMYAVCNVLRDHTQNLWRMQRYRRGGRGIHRTAIERGARVIVRRVGQDHVGYVGIARKDRHSAIVNVLEPGFRHRGGRRVSGRGVRARVLALAQTIVPEYARIIRWSLEDMASGGRGRVRL